MQISPSISICVNSCVFGSILYAERGVFMDFYSDSLNSNFIEVESLCYRCRYIEKCPRIKSINQKLNTMESKSLEDWRMDIDIIPFVSKCDLFEGIDDITVWVNGGDSFGRK